MTPEAASLIERARNADNPNARDRARVRRALASTLGTGVFTALSSSAAGTSDVVARGADVLAAQPSAGIAAQSMAAAGAGAAGAGALPGVTTAAAGLGKLVAWAGIGFLAGATGIGGAKQLVDDAEPNAASPPAAVAPARSGESEQRPRAPAVVPRARSAPVASAAVSELPSKAAPQVSEGRGAHQNSAPPQLPAQRGSGTQLEAELALIEQAQGALRAGDAGRALTLLAEHERRFPRGLLREERLASKTLALCRLGMKSEAERVARALERHNPDSALWPSVALSCGFER